MSNDWSANNPWNAEGPRRKTFQSPYEQYAEHIGKRIVDVTLLIDTDTYDRDEVGDMYVATLADGTEIEAWPEEVFEPYPEPTFFDGRKSD